MSKEIRYYNNINPQTAYIAGIVEAFITPVDMEMSDVHYGVDTDIFWLGDNGIDSLYDVLLNRLRKYNDIDRLNLDLERDSFMPNIPISKLEGSNSIETVTEILKGYCKTEKIKPAARDFFFSVNWYLKQPKAVYKADMQALYEYIPELEKALRSFYLFVISELIFIEYSEYILMLVIGSSE